MKLAQRLTILFALLAIVPVLIVGYLSYDSGRRAVEQQAGNHLLSTNLLKSNELDRWIDGNKNSIEELAQRPLVSQHSAILALHDASNRAYKDAHDNLVNDHLRPRIKSIGGFTELFIICPVHGIILASSDELQEGKYRDAQPYYLQGRIQTYIYGVFFSPAFEQLTMVIGTPVKDKNGKLVAVLAGRLDLDELSSIMSTQTGMSQTEDTYLVNRSNFFVTEPRFGQGYALKKTVRSRGVEEGQSGKDGVGYYTDYRNEPVIGAYKWLPEYQMVLITEVDQAEAYAPIRQMALSIGGIVLVLIVIVVAAGFFTARTVTRPVRRLMAGAERIGHGDLDYRVDTLTKDEIGVLSRSLDRMAAELKETTVSRDKLIESEEKYRLIIENSSDMIYTTNDIGELIYVSPAFEKMLGYKPSQMLGHTLMDFMHPDDVTAVRIATRKYMDKGELTPGLEYRIRHASGSWRWQMTNGNKVLDASGKLVSFVGIAHDITSRKKVENELIESEKRYHKLFNEMLDGFALHEIICDGSGRPVDYRFLEVNPSFEKLTGLHAANVIGRTVLQVIPETEQEWIDRYGKVALTGEPAHFELFSGGLNKYYEVTAFSPQLRQFATIFADVTERKLAEEAINKLNAELEERVLDRTSQLEAANKELEAFSYSVSHDLRSPLRAINGYTQMLMEDYQPKLDDEGKRICSVIAESANNMGTLIDDLLAFSRLGRSDMHQSQVDMATMANSIYYELTTEDDRRRIDFSVGPLPPAFADPSLMRQVWANLISNAIKFSSKMPHAVIAVNGSCGEHENYYSVQDNGAGFDMQYFDKLFGVFQRLHSSHEFEGNGVGLAIVKRIIHRHGGRVWALGEPDKGAVFDFTVPKGGQLL